MANIFSFFIFLRCYHSIFFRWRCKGPVQTISKSFRISFVATWTKHISKDIHNSIIFFISILLFLPIHVLIFFFHFFRKRRTSLFLSFLTFIYFCLFRIIISNVKICKIELWGWLNIYKNIRLWKLITIIVLSNSNFKHRRESTKNLLNRRIEQSFYF